LSIVLALFSLQAVSACRERETVGARRTLEAPIVLADPVEQPNPVVDPPERGDLPASAASSCVDGDTVEVIDVVGCDRGLIASDDFTWRFVPRVCGRISGECDIWVAIVNIGGDGLIHNVRVSSSEAAERCLNNALVSQIAVRGAEAVGPCQVTLQWVPR
jgi:hypothetical protein